jgi:hypothetical protein
MARFVDDIPMYIVYTSLTKIIAPGTYVDSLLSVDNSVVYVVTHTNASLNFILNVFKRSKTLINKNPPILARSYFSEQGPTDNDFFDNLDSRNYYGVGGSRSPGKYHRLVVVTYGQFIRLLSNAHSIIQRKYRNKSLINVGDVAMSFASDVVCLDTDMHSQNSYMVVCMWKYLLEAGFRMPRLTLHTLRQYDTSKFFSAGMYSKLVFPHVRDIVYCTNIRSSDANSQNPHYFLTNTQVYESMAKNYNDMRARTDTSSIVVYTDFEERQISDLSGNPSGKTLFILPNAVAFQKLAVYIPSLEMWRPSETIQTHQDCYAVICGQERGFLFDNNFSNIYVLGLVVSAGGKLLYMANQFAPTLAFCLTVQQVCVKYWGFTDNLQIATANPTSATILKHGFSMNEASGLTMLPSSSQYNHQFTTYLNMVDTFSQFTDMDIKQMIIRFAQMGIQPKHIWNNTQERFVVYMKELQDDDMVELSTVASSNQVPEIVKLNERSEYCVMLNLNSEMSMIITEWKLQNLPIFPIVVFAAVSEGNFINFESQVFAMGSGAIKEMDEFFSPLDYQLFCMAEYIQKNQTIYVTPDVRSFCDEKGLVMHEFTRALKTLSNMYGIMHLTGYGYFDYKKVIENVLGIIRRLNSTTSTREKQFVVVAKRKQDANIVYEPMQSSQTSFLNHVAYTLPEKAIKVFQIPDYIYVLTNTKIKGYTEHLVVPKAYLGINQL